MVTKSRPSEEQWWQYRQFTETSSNTDGCTHSLWVHDPVRTMNTLGEIHPESKLTICTAVSESHPTAEQCIDSKNVEQSQTVDFISSGLLHFFHGVVAAFPSTPWSSPNMWWQPFRRIHGHLPCGDSLSIGFRSSLDPWIQSWLSQV